MYTEKLSLRVSPRPAVSLPPATSLLLPASTYYGRRPLLLSMTGEGTGQRDTGAATQTETRHGEYAATTEAVHAALRLLHAHARSTLEGQRIEVLRAEAALPGQGGSSLIARVRHALRERWPRPAADSTGHETRTTADSELGELSRLCADVEHAVRAIAAERAAPAFTSAVVSPARASPRSRPMAVDPGSARIHEAAHLWRSLEISGAVDAGEASLEMRRRLAAEHEVGGLVQTVNAKLEGAALLRRTEALTYELLHAHSIAARQATEPAPEPHARGLRQTRSWRAAGEGEGAILSEEDSSTSESEVELETSRRPQSSSADSVRAAETAWSEGSRAVVVGWPLEGAHSQQADMAKTASASGQQHGATATRGPLAARMLNTSDERSDDGVDDEEFQAELQELERLQFVLDDRGLEEPGAEPGDENEGAVSSVAASIGSRIPTAKSTRRRRKEKREAAVGAAAADAPPPSAPAMSVGAAAADAPPPSAAPSAPAMSQSNDTLSVTLVQPGPIGIRWVPISHSYELAGTEERYGSAMKNLMRMQVRRIAPGSAAASWHATAGLRAGMLLRAVSVAASPSSGSDAGQATKLVDLVDREIGYDKALQMVKSTHRPLTLVFEFHAQEDARTADSAPVSSMAEPSRSPASVHTSANRQEQLGFAGLDDTKAALIAMADQASAAVSQAASSVKSERMPTPDISAVSERLMTGLETRETPQWKMKEADGTAGDDEQTGAGLVVRALPGDEGTPAAEAAPGTVVSVTLPREGPLGLSFEQHPDPRRRHCARIKHLIPGGQATIADRGGVLHPGLVLLRLGDQDMTRFHAYSAAIDFIRSTTQRPVTLSFTLE